MHELPSTVLVSEDASDPEMHWRNVLAPAHLGAEPLHLDKVRKVRRDLFRNKIESDGFSFSVERGSTFHCLNDLFVSPHEGAERVPEGDVVSLGPQLRGRLGVPPRELIQSLMLLLNNLIEIRVVQWSLRLSAVRRLAPGM